MIEGSSAIARAYDAERRMGDTLSYEGAGGYFYRLSAANNLVALHEPSRALQEAGNSKVRDAGGRAVDSLSILAAVELQDWPAVLRLTGGDGRQAPPAQADQSARARAKALLAVGRIAEAQAAVAAMPDDCTDCLELRGDLAAARGDRAGVDAAYGAATGRGEIPLRDLDWGRALLRLGDTDAAIGKLKRAHKLGPRFADPLELWGEALIRKQDFPGAVDKFAEADRRAPRWARNHLMWGEALMLSGRYAEARRQYVIAGGLDLPKPARAALDVLLAYTASGPLHGRRPCGRSLARREACAHGGPGDLLMIGDKGSDHGELGLSGESGNQRADRGSPTTPAGSLRWSPLARPCRRARRSVLIMGTGAWTAPLR